jgi:16S rRNA (cytidine1402-2'-O)-methyltransferase
MPGISDPGEALIALCYENNIPVTVCPGATAGVTALVLSGLSARRYCFEAFLPSDKREKAAVLTALAEETRTMIFYEAPHRLLSTLKELIAALGDRDAAVIRELTKKHETVRKDMLSGQIAFFEQQPPKGEFVIVIKGADETALLDKAQAEWNETPVADHVALYTAQGMTEKDAMKKAARDRGLSKRDIYKVLKNPSNHTNSI